MSTTRGSKDKDRMGQGPEERRMGPNERGWVEKTKGIFDYTKSVGETIRELGNSEGPSGARSNMGILKVAYMNVGRGCVAAHVSLESCSQKEVDICFVGECWVARDGNGTQSHPDYVMLGSSSRRTKVVVFIRKDIVDGVSLVATTARVVVVELGGCRVVGVYEKCGVGVHMMRDWLGCLEGWIGGGDWVLLGDWNAHHHTWSLDGNSGPGGRVLADWVLERGAEVHFWEAGTFERRRGRDVVQSRIDFAVTLPDSGWMDADADWLLSDHSSIGGSFVIAEVARMDRSEVVEWHGVTATLADNDEGWYGGLVGVTAYDKLLDLRRKHLKLLRVCGRSKRWWNGEIAAQLATVCDHRRRYGRNGQWVRERYRLRNLIQDGKRKCWEDFCTESGEKSPWEVVR